MSEKKLLLAQGPLLISLSVSSWLLVGRDSPRSTLVTSMTKTGNSGGNETSLAEGVIEHTAVYTHCITNSPSLFQNMPAGTC